MLWAAPFARLGLAIEFARPRARPELAALMLAIARQPTIDRLGGTARFRIDIQQSTLVMHIGIKGNSDGGNLFPKGGLVEPGEQPIAGAAPISARPRLG